jgi:hypothetical protein
MLGFVVPFSSLSILCKNAEPRPFCWTNPWCLDFSASNFLLQGHILSTSGAALIIYMHILPCSHLCIYQQHRLRRRNPTSTKLGFTHNGFITRPLMMLWWLVVHSSPSQHPGWPAFHHNRLPWSLGGMRITNSKVQILQLLSTIPTVSPSKHNSFVICSWNVA